VEELQAIMNWEGYGSILTLKIVINKKFWEEFSYFPYISSISEVTEPN
jgi:hypothetical protein